MKSNIHLKRKLGIERNYLNLIKSTLPPAPRPPTQTLCSLQNIWILNSEELNGVPLKSETKQGGFLSSLLFLSISPADSRP